MVTMKKGMVVTMMVKHRWDAKSNTCSACCHPCKQTFLWKLLSDLLFYFSQSAQLKFQSVFWLQSKMNKELPPHCDCIEEIWFVQVEKRHWRKSWLVLLQNWFTFNWVNLPPPHNYLLHNAHCACLATFLPPKKMRASYGFSFHKHGQGKTESGVRSTNQVIAISDLYTANYRYCHLK